MKSIYIDGLSGKIRTALKENGELTEIIYESESEFEVGNIYIGRVTKVFKEQFVFVNIGDDKNAFLQPDIHKEPVIYNENGKIAIKEGDSLLVQVTKPAVDEKGAVVTTRLNFTGKYCVVIANDNGIGISKKITDENKREKLKELAKSTVPQSFGAILRTECENIDEKIIENELKSIVEKANDLIAKASYIKPPTLIYEELNKTVRIVRDLAYGENTEVITNSAIIADDLVKQLGEGINISVYNDKIPLFHNFGIESAIEKALHRKIWLKSGGYLIIDYTEAMNVIDVNSGKHTGKKLKDFALKVNLEAAVEAAKQIRLRNLTGMIIIDFIDMQSSEDIDKVSKKLKECIANDRITTSLVGMTSLGLMQLTRKKNSLPLHKILMRDCPVCCGSGITENEFYIFDKIINELISLFSQTIYNQVKIRGSKQLISVIKRHINQIQLIEEKYNARLFYEEISTGKLYYYELVKEINRL